MTANSIAYAKYQEDSRHNAVMEALERRKREVEELQARTAERKQLADAHYQKLSVSEQIRHNTEVENETKYFNNATKYLQYLAHQEDVLHNRNTESINSESNQIGWVNADINQQNATLRGAELDERVRSNKEGERLTERGQNFGLAAAQTTASASMYTADRNYSSSVYATDSRYRTDMYATDVQSQDKKYSVDMTFKGTKAKVVGDIIKQRMHNQGNMRTTNAAGMWNFVRDVTTVGLKGLTAIVLGGG